MASGIYQIENRINGKRYIGSAVRLSHRRKQHLSDLRCGRHCNPHLQAAFDKYGEHEFAFEVLGQVPSDNLIVREQHYLDTLGPEYNIAPTAGNQLGYRHSQETRRKISESGSGKRHNVDRRGERNSFHDKHHSKEACGKMRAAWTPERREAQSGERNSFYGKQHSSEAKRKMSMAWTPERREALRKRRARVRREARSA